MYIKFINNNYNANKTQIIHGMPQCWESESQHQVYLNSLYTFIDHFARCKQHWSRNTSRFSL